MEAHANVCTGELCGNSPIKTWKVRGTSLHSFQLVPSMQELQPTAHRLQPSYLRFYYNFMKAKHSESSGDSRYLLRP